MPPIILALSLPMLIHVAQAGIFFESIRPRPFKIADDIDIHVGDAMSQKSLKVTDYLDLPYCEHPERGHEDELDDDSWTKGVTLFDTDLHESFFKYKVGQNKINA